MQSLRHSIRLRRCEGREAVLPKFTLHRQLHALGGLAQGRIVERDVSVSHGRPPVPEQASGHMQAFAVHDRVGSVRVSQVMKPRIRQDPRRVARLDPE